MPLHRGQEHLLALTFGLQGAWSLCCAQPHRCSLIDYLTLLLEFSRKVPGKKEEMGPVYTYLWKNGYKCTEDHCQEPTASVLVNTRAIVHRLQVKKTHVRNKE